MEANLAAPVTILELHFGFCLVHLIHIMCNYSTQRQHILEVDEYTRSKTSEEISCLVEILVYALY